MSARAFGRPRLLDLYCGEGGASTGYVAAGWDVLGVDFVRQPRYPFRIHRGDALEFVREHGAEFDAIHASPPCQDHSSLHTVAGLHGTGWMLEATREALIAVGRPWVIENVEGAPMAEDSLLLCGSMFGLGAHCVDGVYRYLRRHRLFESSVPLRPPRPCAHVGHALGVYGNGGGAHRGGVAYKGVKRESIEAMGIDWMSRAGRAQAIPPVYTYHVGSQLMSALSLKVAA